MAFRSQFTQLMTRDLYKWFFETYDLHQPVYPKVFKVIQSDSSYEKSTTGVGLGKLTERPEGDNIVASNPLEGFTVYGKNRTFSDSFYLTAEFVEDTPPEKIGNIMRDLAGTWGNAVMQTKETYAAKFFNYGGYTAGHDVFNNSITGVVTDPTGDLCYDSKPFFNLSNNTRSSKGGGTYYNGAALSLSVANLQTQYTLMTVTNSKNERDEVVAIKPNVILIPPNLRFTAATVLESDKIVGSANNDINPVQNIVQRIEWNYLTDTDAWFTGVAQQGLEFQERKAPVIDFYQDELSKKFYASIDARWGGKVTNWRFWVGSNFSTS